MTTSFRSYELHYWKEAHIDQSEKHKSCIEAASNSGLVLILLVRHGSCSQSVSYNSSERIPLFSRYLTQLIKMLVSNALDLKEPNTQAFVHILMPYLLHGEWLDYSSSVKVVFTLQWSRMCLNPWNTEIVRLGHLQLLRLYRELPLYVRYQSLQSRCQP